VVLIVSCIDNQTFVVVAEWKNIATVNMNIELLLQLVTLLLDLFFMQWYEAAYCRPVVVIGSCFDSQAYVSTIAYSRITTVDIFA
jgi:hypothetical protein